MATPAPAPARRAPAILKVALGMMVSAYRWSGGAIGGRMGPNKVLLLTTTGRKSGKAHTIPLSYFETDGALFIVASNGGQPRHPAWYLNLLANPTVTIQRGKSIQKATATTADADQRAQLWAHVVATAAAYGKYQTKTTREIPIVLLRVTS
jgi:deazaflavin-dependent oxidoreductase (nitroreductase family)